MSRVDVPTLQCDRCKTKTQDLTEMGRFQSVENYHMGGTDDWDLCPDCFRAFKLFLQGGEVNGS